MVVLSFVNRSLTINDIEDQTDLIEVKANGMGFMLNQVKC